MKKGIKELMAEANAQIEAMTPQEAQLAAQNEDVLLVDIRDIRELQRMGKVPGAIHAPRGMLEFWIDPESPYHREEFSMNKKLIFFCAAGWRSALATKTVQDMGLENVAHIDGGFGAWKEAQLPIDEPEPKPLQD